MKVITDMAATNAQGLSIHRQATNAPADDPVVPAREYDRADARDGGYGRFLSVDASERAAAITDRVQSGCDERSHRRQPQPSPPEYQRQYCHRQREYTEHDGEVIDEDMNVGPGEHCPFLVEIVVDDFTRCDNLRPAGYGCCDVAREMPLSAGEYHLIRVRVTVAQKVRLS